MKSTTSPLGPGHHPDCRLHPFNDVAAELGMDPPDDAEWGAQAGLLRCVDGCPLLEADLEYARTLAKEFGW